MVLTSCPMGRKNWLTVRRSMEEYRREQLDILADGVRNSLDMDAVYRAMGMENPRGCKA